MQAIKSPLSFLPCRVKPIALSIFANKLPPCMTPVNMTALLPLASKCLRACLQLPFSLWGLMHGHGLAGRLLLKPIALTARRGSKISNQINSMNVLSLAKLRSLQVFKGFRQKVGLQHLGVVGQTQRRLLLLRRSMLIVAIFIPMWMVSTRLTHVS